MTPYIAILSSLLISTSAFSSGPPSPTEPKTSLEKYRFQRNLWPVPGKWSSALLDVYSEKIKRLNNEAKEKVLKSHRHNLLYIGGTAGLYHAGVFGIAHPSEGIQLETSWKRFNQHEFLSLQEYDDKGPYQYSQFVFDIGNSTTAQEKLRGCYFENIIISPYSTQYFSLKNLKNIFSFVKIRGHLLIPLTEINAYSINPEKLPHNVQKRHSKWCEKMALINSELPKAFPPYLDPYYAFLVQETFKDLAADVSLDFTSSQSTLITRYPLKAPFSSPKVGDRNFIQKIRKKAAQPLWQDEEMSYIVITKQ